MQPPQNVTVRGPSTDPWIAKDANFSYKEDLYIFQNFSN